MPGRQFVDRQVDGPFASWEHVHRFVPIDDERSELLDHIEYSLPAGGLTDSVGEGPAGKTLARLFRFRHERTRLDLGRHARVGGPAAAHGGHRRRERPHRLAPGRLPDDGRPPRRPARAQRGGRARTRSPGTRPPARSYHGALEGVDAVVNLAGVVTRAALDAARRKQAIMDSRVQATRTLAEAIARMDSPPPVFVSVSAVGAYGSRGGEAITEETELGEGFLADVCRAWEEAAAPAADAGVRLVTPALRHRRERGRRSRSPRCCRRSGPGSATRLGDGDQYWAWVDSRRPARARSSGRSTTRSSRAWSTSRAGAGDQPRVHQDPGARAAPSGRVRGAVLRPAPRPGRNGRRDAARQSAGRARRGSRSAASASPSPRLSRRLALRARAQLSRRPQPPRPSVRDGHGVADLVQKRELVEHVLGHVRPGDAASARE